MRSDTMKKGVIRSQHRDIFYSMCYTRREIDQPILGVVNPFNQFIPASWQSQEHSPNPKEAYNE
jgi:dihydroxy-acid dehydratase